MENYRYRLEYTNGDSTLIYTFPADITAEDIKWNLQSFLLASSWGMKQIKEILNLEGEE